MVNKPVSSLARFSRNKFDEIQLHRMAAKKTWFENLYYWVDISLMEPLCTVVGSYFTKRKKKSPVQFCTCCLVFVFSFTKSLTKLFQGKFKDHEKHRCGQKQNQIVMLKLLINKMSMNLFISENQMLN